MLPSIPVTAQLPPASLAIDAREQDAYWSRAWRNEGYAKEDRDYEDYAPAYCVGYVGYAQYGGSFDDAWNSLYANWERIRGGSRLRHQEALAPIRAGWDRVARQALVAVSVAQRPPPSVDVGTPLPPANAEPFRPEVVAPGALANHLA